MEIKTETLPGGTVLYTGAGQPITTDSLLLAEFCRLKPGWSACDLGCGSGLLLLSLLDRGLQGRAVGVEQNGGDIELLRRATLENGLENVEAVHGDLRTYRSSALFDLVVANPPYYDSGAMAKAPGRAHARHEVMCSIGDVCAAAKRLLKDGGSLCLCWPPARLESLFGALAKNRLAPKRMQLVRKAPGAPPWLCLLDARKAGGEGLSVMEDRLLPAGEPLRY